MKKRLFDSNLQNIVHYFVRPTDDFVLNSLEKLDCDEYLYRLLREEGYRRLVFFSVSANDYPVYTYDLLSELSYLKPMDFTEVNLDEPKTLEDFFQKRKKQEELNQGGLKGIKTPKAKSLVSDKVSEKSEYGKRIILRLVTNTQNSNSGSLTASLKAQLLSFVMPALQAKNIKSAIVMDLELLEQVFDKEPLLASKTASDIVDIFTEINKENSEKKNIFLFTAKSCDRLLHIINKRELHKIHEWIDVDAISKGSTGKMLQTLEESGYLVISESIGIDEIANLILRKKFVENTPGFSDVPVSKVYPLAKMIQSHISYEKRCFQSIPYRKPDRGQDYIRILNSCFSSPEVLQELLSKCNQIKPVELIALDNPVGAYVERVSHNYVSYYKDGSYEEILSEFDNYTGMESVKQQIDHVISRYVHKKSKQNNKSIFMNVCFVGPQGTGKSTVAEIFARLMKSKKLLPSNKTMFVKASELIGKYHNETEENFIKAIKDADGGVLVIDEFYAINSEYGSNSNTADGVLAAMCGLLDRYKDTISVIILGYEKEIEATLTRNSGAKGRFPETVHFKNYGIDEMLCMFSRCCSNDGYTYNEDFAKRLNRVINREMESKGKDFQNARYITEELYPKIEYAMSLRDVSSTELLPCDIVAAYPEAKSIIEKPMEKILSPMDELDEMIGLKNVKAEIKSILNGIRYPAGNETPLPGHYLFLGNPGTGKTEVARLMGKILHNIGVLRSGHIIEVDRGKLVGNYLGQTENKTLEYCNQALGGVLFVDEAHRLFDSSNNTSYSLSALYVILKFMEDHRRECSVIFAGYEKNMEKLDQIDDGFQSRFSYKINFPDYTSDELVQILKFMAKKKKYLLSNPFIEESRNIFCNWVENKKDNFGNARAVRKYLENANKKRASRIAAIAETGKELTKEEIELFIEEDAIDIEGSNE